jgi:ribonuclease HII
MSEPLALNTKESLVSKARNERELWKQGLTALGLDEVGRGCWAGPVYAAACIIDAADFKTLKPKARALVRDSKTLSKSQRQEAEKIVYSVARRAAVAMADVHEVDRIGILKASFLAMRRATLLLSGETFDVAIVDGKLRIPNFEHHQRAIVEADSKFYSVAGASIIAKEARDRWMQKASELYPGYGFDHNAGYGTKEHQQGISKFGLCPLHRMSFRPIREAYEQRTSIDTNSIQTQLFDSSQFGADSAIAY